MRNNWKIGDGFDSLEELHQALEDGCTLNMEGILYKKGLKKYQGAEWMEDRIPFDNYTPYTIHALPQIGMTMEEVAKALMENDWKIEGYFSDDGEEWTEKGGLIGLQFDDYPFEDDLDYYKYFTTEDPHPKPKKTKVTLELTEEQLEKIKEIMS